LVGGKKIRQNGGKGNGLGTSHAGWQEVGSRNEPAGIWGERPLEGPSREKLPESNVGDGIL